MKMFCLHSTLALISCICFANAGTLNEDLPPPDDVKAVFVGFRHANRNPGQFLKDDPNEGKWGQEGTSQLTNIGRQQAFSYGTMLRERYDDLVDDDTWTSKDTKAFSSSAERVQATVQMVLRGLYAGDASDLINAAPVPYSIDDPLLRMYSVDCPVGDASWKPVYDAETPDGKKLAEDNQEIIDFVAEQTGLEPTLSDMADVADNLEGMHIRGLEFPDWVENNKFGRSIYEDIEKLAEAPQVLCSKFDKCRKMMAGYWLEDIAEKLDALKTGGDGLPPNMTIYGTHNEIMASLLWLMGYERDHGVYFHGSGILEYRETPTQAVRLIYSEPTPEDPKVRVNSVVTMNFCQEEWCPLDTFMEGIKDSRVDNYETECMVPVCFCTPNPEAPKAEE